MKLRLCDFLTLMNAACGLISILLVLLGRFSLAPFFIIAAALFDLLDGKVARMMKTESELGRQLDSLADAISFGVAPVVLGFGKTQGTFAVIAFTAYLMCGILRLARHNVQKAKGVYFGMPIPLGAIIICVASLLRLRVIFYPYLFLVLAGLMISSFRVRKLVK